MLHEPPPQIDKWSWPWARWLYGFWQRFSDLASTDTDDGTKGRNLVSIPPIAGETGIENHAFARDNVLRFIPWSLHASIRDGTNTTALTTYIQNAIDSIMVYGGKLNFPRGEYNADSGLLVDLRGITGAPNSNLRRINIEGDGQGNTVLTAKTDSQNIFYILGDNPTTTASHTYASISNIGFAGNTPTSRTATGLKLEDIAYFVLRDVGFHNLNVGINNISCISSEFYSCNFNESVKGIIAQQATGVSDPNANAYYGCTFRQLTSVAFDGFGGMSNGLFSGCNFEGNGTQGDSATGAVNLRMDGSAGEVGPIFIGCYFESNKGGFDAKLASTGTRRITANFIGVNFNRVSSSSYVTTNIDTSGDINLNTVGCSFTPYNTYSPSAARPVVTLGSTSRWMDQGSSFYSSTDIPANLGGSVFSGDVTGEDGAGFGSSSYILPIGWSASRSAAGHYVITHNLGHTNYAVTATSSSGFQRSVERCVKSANSFQIRTVTGATTTLVDCDTTFILQAFQPSIT